MTLSERLSSETVARFDLKTWPASLSILLAKCASGSASAFFESTIPDDSNTGKASGTHVEEGC